MKFYYEGKWTRQKSEIRRQSKKFPDARRENL